MKEKYERESYDTTVTGGFSKKAENFWYHYKWHTIAAIFIVIVVTVCTMQMCSRTDYDVHVLYAGGKSFGKTADSNEYATINDALRIVSEDFDENGENSPLFQSFLFPTDKEDIAKYADLGMEALIENDKKSFVTAMTGSKEYYLCFLSPEIFAMYDIMLKSGDTPLIALNEYAHADQLTESGRGIKLAETDFYKLPGISNLPDDTIICIRTLSPTLGDRENYEKSLVLLKNIMAYSLD